jgi:hypothetical protein
MYLKFSIFKKIDFPGFNFSFKKTKKDTYIGTIRQVDYFREKPSQYPEVFNLTYILELDSEFNVISNYLLNENLDLLPKYTNYTSGIEDTRLLDNNTFICVSLYTNPNWKTEMVYCELSHEEKTITKMVRMHLEEEPYRNQKNWLFLNKVDNVIHLLYLYNPIQIISVDLLTGKGTIIKSYVKENIDINSNEYELHGGASVYLEKMNKYLVTIRKIKDHRFIDNYWLLFDEKYELVGISKPFIFEVIDVEINYQMCMSLHIENDLLYAAVSINDNFVNIYKFNIDDIIQNLQTV